MIVAEVLGRDSSERFPKEWRTNHIEDSRQEKSKVILELSWDVGKMTSLIETKMVGQKIYLEDTIPVVGM